MNILLLQPYIPILRIVVLHYSNFRLIDMGYEDYWYIFSKELTQIQHLVGHKNIFFYENTAKSEERFFFQEHETISIELRVCLWLLPLKKDARATLEEKKRNIENQKYLWKNFQEALCIVIDFIQGTHINDDTQMLGDLECVRDLDEGMYVIFASIYTTFRWKKDLKQSLTYINQAIRIYPRISSLYLFRIRNLFLYLYQKSMGVDVFHTTIQNQPKKILSSAMMKQVFQDIAIAHKLNPHNKIFDLFVGNIYVHLYDDRWVQMLLNLQWHIEDADFQQCLEWVWNYYLFTWNFEQAERYYLSWVQNFKIYRKRIPTYILSKNHYKLQELISQMCSTDYQIAFYITESIQTSTITTQDYILLYKWYKQDYRDINIPLDDLSNLQFQKLINDYEVSQDIRVFFPYMRRNFHRYFLDQAEHAIILKFQG